MEKSGGKREKASSKRKFSFIDCIIEKLPQIHLSGYRYCGPNTNLENNLQHSELGVNKLDCACMAHDFAYAESSDLEFRCAADKLLVLRALKRIYATDSQIGERFAALVVAGLISIKLTICRVELYIDKVRKCFGCKI